jgi:hypothetical protein
VPHTQPTSCRDPVCCRQQKEAVLQQLKLCLGSIQLQMTNNWISNQMAQERNKPLSTSTHATPQLSSVAASKQLLQDS